MNDEQTNFRAFISPPEELILEAQQGRMFILADDEDRENEGDLVCPAHNVTPEAINFMATFGRGLICLPMDRSYIEKLKLPMMAASNGSRFHTAFTISIEAKEGVSTGISAFDRAHTILTAVNSLSPEAIVSPGHVFPLVAADGGVLARTGQTEGSVDVMKLAGLPPAAVICEIMNDDGHMARIPDLVKFSQRHGVKLGTVADLVAYRQRTGK